MEKIKVRQAIIVEGRYDKARLTTMVDGVILTTGGFHIFRDRQKLALIRRLAETSGIVLLTDSDAAGFRIRSYLAGAVDKKYITHVYIPDLFGKEHRKAKAGAEGKLGVEGIPSDLLRLAFQRAGLFSPDATLSGSRDANDSESERMTECLPEDRRLVTNADLVEWGLSGGENSAERRQNLLHLLGLPARMNVKGMLAVVNKLYSYNDFKQKVDGL